MFVFLQPYFYLKTENMMHKTILISVALFLGQLFVAQPIGGASTAAEKDNYVYICTGKSSKRYHKTDRCKGLDNCKGTVKKVTLSQAEDKGRTPCKICYKKK